MSKQTIWTYLRGKGLPENAVAGIMGNMEAESNCEAMRVQGDFTAGRTVSRSYAQSVNFGTLSPDRFCSDSKGWGLCQWTYWTRKQELYYFCQERGKGIEDEETQLDFMLREMERDFPVFWNLLQTADIATVASRMCTDFEKPAVKNTAARTEYAKQIYEQFHGQEFPKETEDKEWILDGIEYWETVKADVQAKIDDLRGRL